jgi:hypothetical protein
MHNKTGRGTDRRIGVYRPHALRNILRPYFSMGGIISFRANRANSSDNHVNPDMAEAGGSRRESPMPGTHA